MDNVETEYSGLVRRLAAHLVDLVIVSSVLILHGMRFRILRAAGMWNLTNAESVSPEELWQSFIQPCSLRGLHNRKANSILCSYA